MDRPILRDGGALIESGRIVGVDAANSLRAQHPHAEVIDYPRSILMPGLVNAHVHLELSDCDCGPPPTGGFAGWLIGMLRRTRITPEEMAEKVTRAISLGVAQCGRFGVTCVGDISRQVDLSRPLLRDARLRVVSFGEIMAMAQRRVLLEERLALATDRRYENDHLRIGLTPHAPYSVEIDAYRRCLEVARLQQLPLATHLAETEHEATFLANNSGPFRDLWDAWLTWDDHVPTFSGGPIRLAKQIGLLDYPTLLAHVNYCDDAELDLLAAGKASVVYCPRTHAYFGHPPHRWREMLARGVNVAVGTDSCASSRDLNLVEDLRLLRKLAPAVDVQSLWQMATIRAAKAIRMESDVGTISAGKFADIISFEITSDSPLEEILREDCAPHAVYFQGEQCPSLGV
jgi:cytosine/adenosine deaminase-related metal-dependent hydrolase